MKKFELFNNKYLGVLIELNRLCIINVNIIRIIYNLLIKNIIDMSVDTVNTIVDITTLAEIQNELTNLAAIPMLVCTKDVMTLCVDPNTTCSGACATPKFVTAAADSGDNTAAMQKTAMEAAAAVTAKLTYCVPPAGGDVLFKSVLAVTLPGGFGDYTLTCAKGAMFLKAVSSVVAATMVMHLA